MATKKAAPKKATKTAKTAPKAKQKSAPAKKAKAAPAKKSKPLPKKAVKKAAPKKAAPAKKSAASSKSAKPVKAAKATVGKKETQKPQPKAAAKAPLKTVKPAPKPAAKAAVKPAPKAPVKVAPAKPVPVEVKSKPEVHSYKPVEKPVKKEPAKPKKIIIPKTTTDKKIPYEPDFTRSVLDSNRQQQQTGPTQRYSDQELNEFRELIQKKLDTAKKELAYLQGLITRKDESGDLDEGRYMTMEDGSMSMEREQLSQMASRQIQFIDHLEKALMRIENKTYGICRVTGKLIDKARLRAVPHATLSIEAKQMMNK